MLDDTSSPSYFPGFKMYDDPPQGMSVAQWQQHLSKASLNYAISKHGSLRARQLVKINGLYDSFNGLINESQFKHINQTYERDNVIRYKDYRLGRNKVELLVGEWLTRERYDRVQSINPDAKSEIFDSYLFQLGLKHSKKELDDIRKAGVPVLDGIEPMDMDDEEIFDFISSKRKGTYVMQMLLKKGIEMEDCWTKLASTFSDCTIAAESHCRTYIDEGGYARMEEIDPRDRMFEECDRDPFLLKSPYQGHKRTQYLHDIAMNEKLTPTEWKELKEEIEASTNGSSGMKGNYGNTTKSVGLQGGISSWNLEWMAIKPIFIKESPAKFGSPYRKMLSDEYYQENRSDIEKKVKRGDFKIQAYPVTYVWEARRYGEKIYKGLSEKKNQLRSISNPYLAEYSYSSLLFRTHDGTRISLYNTLDHVSELYNANMHQIRRELYKLKGKVMAYDRAFLPEGKRIEDVILRMINDGIIDIDSSTDKAQFAGGQVMAKMLTEFDLGLSSSFQALILLKQELERTSDLLSGVSNSRQGNTPASMTATNAVNQIQVSRTSTEYLFHSHHEFTKKAMRKFLQCLQLSFGHFHQEDAQQLLGDKGALYLKEIANLPLDTFDLSITDGRKESEARQKMDQWFPQAINAGEMRVNDALEASLSDTIDEALSIVRNGWDVLKKQQGEQQQAQGQQQQAQQGQMLQARAEEVDSDRKFKAFMEILKSLLEQGKITQQAMNDYQMMAQEFTQGEPAMQQPGQMTPQNTELIQ